MIDNPELQNSNKRSLDSTSIAFVHGQYKQLHQRYTKLIQDHDILNLAHKKLQLKFLSENPENIKIELAKYRQENQYLRQQAHQQKQEYILVMNKKNQIESQLKAKETQALHYKRELEKQKILRTENKFQASQRQKMYKNVIQNMEKSGGEVVQKYDEIVHKWNSAEQLIKMKKQENKKIQHHNTELKQQLQHITAKLHEEQSQYKEQCRKKDQKLKELENKMFQITKNENIKSQELEQKNMLLASKNKTIELLSIRKSQKVQQVQDAGRLQLKLKEKEAENENMKGIILGLEEKNKVLERGMKELQRNDQLFILRSDLKKLQREKTELTVFYEKQVRNLKTALQHEKVKQIPVDESLPYRHNIAFQDVLRTTLDQKTKLKLELQVKVNEVHNLKAEQEDLKSQIMGLQSQRNIIERKLKTEQKNMRIQSTVHEQNSRNEVESIKRKLQSMQAKIQSKAREIKEKDAFIMNNIVGRTKSQDVSIVMRDLERILETNYVEKLVLMEKKVQELEAKVKSYSS